MLRRRGLRVLENLVLDAVPEGDYGLIAPAAQADHGRCLAGARPCCGRWREDYKFQTIYGSRAYPLRQ